MLRTEILETANEYITKDRAATHGDAENSFAQIAAVWTWWLNERLTAPIDAYDVAQMMSLFKKARAMAIRTHMDSVTDDVGYTAIAGEIASRQK